MGLGLVLLDPKPLNPKPHACDFLGFRAGYLWTQVQCAGFRVGLHLGVL